MRRLAPLSFLAFALGCGGSETRSVALGDVGGIVLASAGGTAPVMQVVQTDTAAVDLDSDLAPRFARYDKAAGSVRVVSAGGTVRLTLDDDVVHDASGIVPALFVFSGDHILISTRRNRKRGTTVLNVATKAARFDAHSDLARVDGGRAIWGSPFSGLVLEDLATGAETPVDIADNTDVGAFRDDRLIVSRYVPGEGSLNSGTTRYQMLDLSEGRFYDLPIPSGYRNILPHSIGDGQTVLGAATLANEGGNGYPSHIVRWSATGAVFSVDGSVHLPLGISDGGSILASALDGSLEVRQGTVWRKLGITVVNQIASLSRRGLIVTTDRQNKTLAAYRAF